MFYLLVQNKKFDIIPIIYNHTLIKHEKIDGEVIVLTNGKKIEAVNVVIKSNNFDSTLRFIYKVICSTYHIIYIFNRTPNKYELFDIDNIHLSFISENKNIKVKVRLWYKEDMKPGWRNW